MNLLKLPLACLLVISIALAIPVAAQQKRRTQEKSPTKTPAAPAPAPPTFDTLLAANSFNVYGEVRGVGQIFRSSANELLEPILKLGGPSQEFRTFVNWLRRHADEVMTSRLLVAAWPTIPDAPDVLVAIEFSSAEEAAKFESQLNSALPNILPPVMPQSSPEPDKKSQSPTTTDKPATDKPATDKAATDKPKEPPTPVPAYHLQRAGSLLLISPKPLELKKLKPRGSKPLAEDPNFRVAYNRFSSDPIFVYVDIQALEKEQQEREKQYEEIRMKEEEARKAAAEKENEKEKTPEEEEATAADNVVVTEKVQGVGVFGQPSPSPEGESTSKEPSNAEVLSQAFSALQYGLFVHQTDMPDAVGIGFSPENDSFDLRALLIDSPGENSDAIPIFSGLRIGAPVSPQSPSVLPADSDLVLIFSLDLDDIYTRLSAPDLTVPIYTLANGAHPPGPVPPEVVGPLATIEKTLKINTKEDLLPLLGSEIGVGLPLTSMNLFGPPRTGLQQGKPDEAKTESRGPFVVVSLRDREGMRRFMPKLLEGFAGKAAASLAQTERREDTELVSYANMFAYAFVGNFLVLSSDAATTRYVVDSYLKQQTLSADAQYKNYTRWQPRQVQGQVYVSPAFTDLYKTWASGPNSHLSDESRALFSRFTAIGQPITYSLSNDGLGYLHELHVPKNVILLAIAGIASSENPPETVKNERTAMGMMWAIAGAQRTYKTQHGPAAFASLDQLFDAGLMSKDTIESSGYKFEVRITAEGYEVTAVPAEYGKTGKLSFFMDQTGIIRGVDRAGAPASASDPPIN